MEVRKKVIHYHTSGDTAPLAENIEYGEIAVSHNDDSARLYIKKNNGEIAIFTDKDYLDSLIGEINRLLEEI